MRPHTKLWSTLLAATALVTVTAIPALAHDLGSEFEPQRSQSWVGTCGGNKANLVKAVQAMLWQGGWYAEAGYFNNLAQVDGVAGTKTKNAIKKFQADHGLSQDGCVGPATWNTFFNGHSHMGSADHWAAASSDGDGNTWDRHLHFTYISEYTDPGCTSDGSPDNNGDPAYCWYELGDAYSGSDSKVFNVRLWDH